MLHRVTDDCCSRILVKLNCDGSKDNLGEGEKGEVDHKGQNELKYHKQIFYTLTRNVPGFFSIFNPGSSRAKCPGERT
jgi:hypothetical protein